jgi:hypothetical protein
MEGDERSPPPSPTTPELASPIVIEDDEAMVDAEKAGTINTPSTPTRKLFTEKTDEVPSIPSERKFIYELSEGDFFITQSAMSTLVFSQ